MPLDWKAYLESILHVELADDETVIVQNPEYLRSLPRVLDRAGGVTLANYLVGSAAADLLGTLDGSAREIGHRYSRRTTGVKARTPIWKECAMAVGAQVRGWGGLRHTQPLLGVTRATPMAMPLVPSQYCQCAFSDTVKRKKEPLEQPNKINFSPHH